jgi:hypothetical protein
LAAGVGALRVQQYRTFRAGFLAMNPKGRPSQPDPEEPVAVSLMDDRFTLELDVR